MIEPLHDCKLCRSDLLSAINTKIRAGETEVKIKTWASSAGLTFHRQTFYKHRDFLLSDKTKEVRGILRERGAGSIRSVTNDEYLEAIRDRAMASVEAADFLPVKDGLAAVKIMESRKQGNTNILVLARILTGQVPRVETAAAPPAIEGSFVDVTAQLEESK